MRVLRNTGSNRVVDELSKALARSASLDIASPDFSLFAYAELRDALENIRTCRLVLSSAAADHHGLTGSEADRHYRNRLQVRWLAKECSDWLRRKVEVRMAPGRLPQSVLAAGTVDLSNQCVMSGSCTFTTGGLGITPGDPFGLVQCSEGLEESEALGSWFAGLWDSLPLDGQEDQLSVLLHRLAEWKPPSLLYYLMLLQVFTTSGEELDEELVVKSATGIRNTTVWKKLYKFQRNGVIGAIDKLERLGGCIIADSVGLGKTFSALAIIKYYELRNDRVLVLVPKRLRDNWTLYKANGQRVPKKLLLEYGTPTSADRRQVQEGIEAITWVASLKPSNIGVPSFKDHDREYVEIAVCTVEFRLVAKAPRLIELMHRAIPYPLVLVSGREDEVTLSLAHKRWSQGEAGKTVIEEVRKVTLRPEVSAEHDAAFLKSLAISGLPSRDLFTVYDGILARLIALESARITHVFAPPTSPEAAATIRDGLEEYSRLEREIQVLRANAAKEKQLSRRVEANLALKRLESRLAIIKDAL